MAYPQIGDKFDSVTELRLACHRAARMSSSSPSAQPESLADLERSLQWPTECAWSCGGASPTSKSSSAMPSGTDPPPPAPCASSSSSPAIAGSSRKRAHYTRTTSPSVIVLQQPTALLLLSRIWRRSGARRSVATRTTRMTRISRIPARPAWLGTQGHHIRLASRRGSRPPVPCSRASEISKPTSPNSPRGR